jgi:hypothetical protein
MNGPQVSGRAKGRLDECPSDHNTETIARESSCSIQLIDIDWRPNAIGFC